MLWPAALIIGMLLGGADGSQVLVSPRSRSERVSCGPAAASVVMAFHKREVVDERLRGLVDTEGSTSFADLCRFFREQRLDAIPLRARPEDVSQLRGIAILQLALPRAENAESGVGDRTEHFVVAIGDGHSSIRILDTSLPREVQHRMSLESALRNCTGNILVVREIPIRLGPLGAGIGGLSGAAVGFAIGRYLARRRIGRVPHPSHAPR